MSSITKRHVPTSQLLGEYLTFVPTPQQVDHFKVDMRKINPKLLRDSIREAVKVQALQQISIPEQRLVIHRIYARKVKEFSPISTPSCLRSRTLCARCLPSLMVNSMLTTKLCDRPSPMASGRMIGNGEIHAHQFQHRSDESLRLTQPKA